MDAWCAHTGLVYVGWQGDLLAPAGLAQPKDAEGRWTIPQVVGWYEEPLVHLFLLTQKSELTHFSRFQKTENPNLRKCADSEIETFSGVEEFSECRDSRILNSETCEVRKPTSLRGFTR